MSAQFNAFENALDFSFWRELCEKHGTLRHFRRGEYFARTGEVLKNAGWIVSGGFKHSLIDNFGNAKTVGFVFDGSVLANYISSMHGNKIPTDIIALEDSDVLVIPSSLIREKLMFDPTLYIKFLDALFRQAYEQMLNNYRSTPEQRYRRLPKKGRATKPYRFPSGTDSRRTCSRGGGYLISPLRQARRPHPG